MDSGCFNSSFIKLIDIGFIIIDSQLNAIEINDCLLSHFDITCNYKGMPINKIIGDKIQDTALIYGMLSDVIRKGISINDSMVLRKKNNLQACCYKISINPLNINNQKYAILAITITDKGLDSKVKESADKYKMIFDNITQGFSLHEIITDENGKPCDYRYLDVNPAFEKITGFKANYITGKKISDLMPAVSGKWVKRYGAVALTGEPCRFEEYSAESDRYFSIWAFSPQKGKFATVLYDITDVKNIEKALKESESKFKKYIDNAPDGVFVSDLNGNYTDVNNSACRMTGYEREELINLNLKHFTPAGYHKDAVQAYKILFESGSVSIELPFIKKNNELRYWSIDAVKLSDTEFIGFYKDITEKRIMQEKLQYNFYHDQLTGLYNRRFLNHHMYRFDKPEMLPLTVLVGDINGLKVVNNAFGHSFGDRLIKLMAEIVTSACGEKDIVAKWGGDEFIVLMPESDIGKARETIGRIKSLCENKAIEDINLSISFGYAAKNSHEENLEDVLKIAEDMMIKNKIYESASFRSQTISMILKTLHEKNKREEQHSIRVSKICIAIGKAMNMSDYDINRLRVIGLLHDIGKIGIDENILNKEGKLTESEFNEIKKHPEIGYRILSSNTETSELAQHILCHHERYDGKGYPGGTNGELLSDMTKILTVADSYDAMTSERPYKNPMSKVEAVQELMRCSAKQFDPLIVEIFISRVLNSNVNFDSISCGNLN